MQQPIFDLNLSLVHLRRYRKILLFFSRIDKPLPWHGLHAAVAKGTQALFTFIYLQQIKKLNKS